MADWLKWAFEGVGAVLFATAVGFLLKQRFLVKENQVPKTQTFGDVQTVTKSPGSLSVLAPVTGSAVAVGANIQQSYEVHHHHPNRDHEPELVESKPTSKQILEEIGKLPPFLANQARLDYQNLTVCWHLRLRSIESYGSSKWIVACIHHEDQPLAATVVLLSFTESMPPELRTTKQDTPLWARGKIESVGTSYITLTEPTILKLEHL
jgi:hypothetical protein